MGFWQKLWDGRRKGFEPRVSSQCASWKGFLSSLGCPASGLGFQQQTAGGSVGPTPVPAWDWGHWSVSLGHWAGPQQDEDIEILGRGATGTAQPCHFAWSLEKAPRAPAAPEPGPGGSETLLTPTRSESWAENVTLDGKSEPNLDYKDYNTHPPHPTTFSYPSSPVFSPPCRIPPLPARPWLQRERQQLAGTRRRSRGAAGSCHIHHGSAVGINESATGSGCHSLPSLCCFHMAARRPLRFPSPANYSRSSAALLPPHSQLHYSN